MFYDRQIKYLDYLENKERVRGVGFLKMEVRDNLCELHIKVNGMHLTDSFARKVLLVGETGETELCEIELEKGRGTIDLLKLDGQNLAGSNISYMQLYGIRIPIAAGKEIYCAVRDRAAQVYEEEKTQADNEPQQEDALQVSEIQPENAQQLEKAKQPENAQQLEQAKQPENVQLSIDSRGQTEDTDEQKVMKDLDTLSEPEPDIIAHNIEDFVNRALQMKAQESQSFFNKGLQESKWKQLTNIYPHIRPFCDERDYLSIGPEDFVILTEKYYAMANNSFLLHGYYNYQHLILGRLMKRGNSTFYIGVPGNYYEKEKQVALLFGFESFECAKEPAQVGDYGYYMMKVEL